MYTDYATHCIEHLRDQLTENAAATSLIAIAANAEQLLREVDAAEMYECGELLESLEIHPETEAAGIAADSISGEALQHDLRRLIEDLTDAANLPAAHAGEPVHTVDELAKMFNVSTKTISRWRSHGLVARKFLFEGRKRIGFLRSSVQQFVDDNPQLVQRARQFRQLTDGERRAIIIEAQRLAESGMGWTESLRQIAREFRKSVETIRQTVRRHEAEHPEETLFPRGDLNEAARGRVYQQYCDGDDVDTLAKRFRQPNSNIRQIIATERARAIKEAELDYIPSDEFDKLGADREILSPAPENEKKQRRTRPPADLPAYLAALYDTPLLTRDQERHLFRQYNYVKYKASLMRKTLDMQRPHPRLMDEIEKLIDRAERLEQQLVKANMRLVVSIAKRYVSPSRSLAELVSDGNISLIRAVQKFDYSRGFKFSTYATWAIVKNFARSLATESKQNVRFRTSQDELLDLQAGGGVNETRQLNEQAARERQVNRILQYLSNREQQIVSARFGLNEPYRRETLKEIGESLGVTKERVRQLERRAMQKLRDAAEKEAIQLED